MPTFLGIFLLGGHFGKVERHSPAEERGMSEVDFDQNFTLLHLTLILLFITYFPTCRPTYLPQPERERDPSKGVICVRGDSKQDISLIDSESRLSCVYSSVCGIFVC